MNIVFDVEMDMPWIADLTSHAPSPEGLTGGNCLVGEEGFGEEPYFMGEAEEEPLDPLTIEMLAPPKTRADRRRTLRNLRTKKGRDVECAKRREFLEKSKQTPLIRKHFIQRLTDWMDSVAMAEA